MDAGFVVLTQNAWGGAPLWKRRAARLARAIADLAPDVVGLQEIHAPEPRDAQSQAHELAAAIGGYRALFAPGRVTASGHAEGVALLVREDVRVVEREVLALSVDPDDALDAPHQRVVLRATVERGLTVDVLCTHLSLSKPARERTAPEAARFAEAGLRRSGAEVAVLVGDLNAAPAEPSLTALDNAGFVDAWERTSPAERGGTWPAVAPFRRLDYVWAKLGEGWAVAECRRMPVAGSDHVGLWARLTGPARGASAPAS